ncbi:hypothetical protein ACWGE0_27425 [Lentzea sp. NPDC054927]
MPSRRGTTRVAVMAAGLLALSFVQAGQAGASAWPNDTWDVSSDGYEGLSVGAVTWANRTATLQGHVQDDGGIVSTTVFFTAYAGATKVDSDTRTASPGEDRPFGDVTIGDPGLVGGFDRLKIQVCETGHPETCSGPVNLNRDGVAEHKHWP